MSVLKDYGGMENTMSSGASGGGIENTVLNTILNLDASTIKDKVNKYQHSYKQHLMLR
jgi:hypothetical protein